MICCGFDEKSCFIGVWAVRCQGCPDPFITNYNVTAFDLPSLCLEGIFGLDNIEKIQGNIMI